MIKEFKNILELIEYLKSDMPTNPLGAQDSDDGFEWIDWGDGDGGRIMPSLNSSFISPFLYRGQTKRFKPCKPKLYRTFPLVDNPQKLSRDERDIYLYNKILLEEFKYTLLQHPSYSFSKEIGLHFNCNAIAQHYGIPTDLLDLTQDYYVAAFFATCYLNNKSQWCPYQNGIGVIYRLDITSFSTNLLKDVLELIGKQTLPRPGEQKAWTFKLPLGADFENYSNDIFIFEHNLNRNQIILEKFNYGKSLFPDDLLSNIADLIMHQNTLSKYLSKKVLLDHKCSPELIEEALEEYDKRFINMLDIRIEDRKPYSLSALQIQLAEEQISFLKNNFLRDVGVRPIKYKGKT